MKTFRMYYLTRIFFLFAVSFFSCFNLSAQDLNPAKWPHLKGYWKFQNISSLTKATVGNNLTLVGTHTWVPGPAYGDTATRIGIGSYYISKHNCAPNGGGDSVNRYTLMFDFKVLNLIRWHTFHQTDTTNTNDGECFIKPSNPPGAIGVGYTGYSADTILPKKWYRLVITVNLGHYYNYYLNGKLIHQGDTDEIFIDKRFALTPKILFFADNNQEDDTIDVASVAIFDTCLSAADIAKIGSIDPCVANRPVVNLGADTNICDYNTLVKNIGTSYKKYLWSTGDTIASVTLTKAKLGIGKHNVWAKVTDVNGCMAADTMSVTFLTPPVVNLGPDIAICTGQNAFLDAGSDTTNTYLWKHLPSGVTISTSKSITVDSVGTYMVIVTSAFGCVNKDTINVNARANPPKPTITVTGLTSFCNGDSVILKAPSGYLLYHWQDGAANDTRIIKNTGWFKVNVTDYKLCTSVYSDSVGVTVYTSPAKPVIGNTGKTVFCEGDSIILDVPSGYLQYFWQDGAGSAQRIEKESGNFYVSVVDSNYCISPVSDSVIVNMILNPSKPVITIIGSSTVCEGNSITLSAPAGYSAYLWSTTEITQTIHITSSKNVSLIVKDSNNCFSPVADSVTLTVNPNPPKPVIKFVGDSSVCEGKTITISGPAGYSVYIWSTSGTTQTIQVTTSQKITLIVKDSYGCTSPVSNSVMAVVHPNPLKPTITKTSDTTLYCTVKGKFYKWFVSESPGQTKIYVPQITQTIKPLKSQKYYYYVVVSDSFGCISDTSLEYYFDPTAIKENSDQKPVIFPNPANTSVVISMKNLAGEGDLFISIIDINGKTVLETKTFYAEIRSGTTVNLQILTQGIYMVKVITPDRIFTGRIQKM